MPVELVRSVQIPVPVEQVREVEQPVPVEVIVEKVCLPAFSVLSRFAALCFFGF